MLAFYIILGIFTISAFNICGVNVTKHISSLARSIVDVSRTLVVWMGSILVTETYGVNNGNFSWENIAVGPMLLEGLGFIVLVCGNLIYNKIIILPFAKPPSNPSFLSISWWLIWILLFFLFSRRSRSPPPGIR